MPCYHPIPAYRLPSGSVVFHDKGDGSPFEVPCGRCVGCRLDKSRVWALRCVHEASLHDENSFITLTYAPEHLPSDGGLVKEDFQKFMKRLRKKFAPRRIRYYMCGEYGDRTNRPHYHALLFGLDFSDREALPPSASGADLFTSKTLEKVWGKGFVTVGDVTFESAAYCARYIMKKLNGPACEVVNDETGLRPYERFDSRTGEIVEVEKEYCAMSRIEQIGRFISHRFLFNRTNRPHYHALLFGLDFSDREALPPSASGADLFTSKTLEKVWGKGFVTVGDVTFESAAYCARYIMKKLNGPACEVVNDETGLRPYERFDSRTGEIVEVEKEYCAMSRRPGIARDWIQKFTGDCYPKDFVTVRGVKVRPPRYYDQYLESVNPDLLDDVKAQRAFVSSLSDDNSELRLSQKKTVKEAQFDQLKRNL